VKVFVPFSEELVEQHGFSIGELVPFRREYHRYTVELLSAEEAVDHAALPRLGGTRVLSQPIGVRWRSLVPSRS
jgi:hypothetical protein